MKQWKRLAWLPALALTVGLLLAGCGQNAAETVQALMKHRFRRGNGQRSGSAVSIMWKLRCRIMARLRWNWMPMLRLPR